MITKWKVFNFKSIQKETELNLAPLTIFAGANSSGKSTVLQSMLLISQTLSHKVGSRPIVLNGALTRLGQFDDLKSFESVADQILIGWECKPQNIDLHGLADIPPLTSRFHLNRVSLNRVNCEISFDTDPSSPNRDIFQLHPRLFSCQLSASARDEENVDVFSNISLIRSAQVGADAVDKIRSLGIADPENEIARSSLDFNVVLDKDSLDDLHEEYLSASAVGCLIRHFLPARL